MYAVSVERYWAESQLWLEVKTGILDGSFVGQTRGWKGFLNAPTTTFYYTNEP